MLIEIYQVPDVLTYTILFVFLPVWKEHVIILFCRSERKEVERPVQYQTTHMAGYIQPTISSHTSLSSLQHVVQLHMGHAVEGPPPYQSWSPSQDYEAHESLLKEGETHSPH